MRGSIVRDPRAAGVAVTFDGEQFLTKHTFMNHTHYLLKRDDGKVFAIIRRPIDGILDEDAIKRAIQEEDGEQVDSMSIETVKPSEQYKVFVRLESGFNYTVTLLPTWEY